MRRSRHCELGREPGPGRSCGTGPAARRHGERGSFAVEMAVLAPILILFLAVVIDAGRLTWANARLESAAQDAARAVSINHNTTQAARASAVTAAQAILASAGVTCVGGPRLTLTPDPAVQPITPGDPVKATVSCRVQLVVLGSRQLTRSVVSRVDRYREAPTFVGGGG